MASSATSASSKAAADWHPVRLGATRAAAATHRCRAVTAAMARRGAVRRARRPRVAASRLPLLSRPVGEPPRLSSPARILCQHPTEAHPVGICCHSEIEIQPLVRQPWQLGHVPWNDSCRISVVPQAPLSDELDRGSTTRNELQTDIVELHRNADIIFIRPRRLDLHRFTDRTTSTTAIPDGGTPTCGGFTQIRNPGPRSPGDGRTISAPSGDTETSRQNNSMNSCVSSGTSRCTRSDHRCDRGCAITGPTIDDRANTIPPQWAGIVTAPIAHARITIRPLRSSTDAGSRQTR